MGLTAGPHLPVGTGPAASPSSAFARTGHGWRAAKPTRGGRAIGRVRDGAGARAGQGNRARARWGGGARGMGGGAARSCWREARRRREQAAWGSARPGGLGARDGGVWPGAGRAGGVRARRAA
jgi:hypothetical protein